MAGSKNIKIATDSNFESEVMKSSKVTLVDFWASWCGPCLQLAPTLDQVADEQTDKVQIYKMNVEENQTTPQKFNILAIPTMLIFKNGKLVDELKGNLPKKTIESALQKHI